MSSVRQLIVLLEKAKKSFLIIMGCLKKVRKTFSYYDASSMSSGTADCSNLLEIDQVIPKRINETMLIAIIILSRVSIKVVYHELFAYFT